MNRRGFLGLLAGGTATLVAAAAEASTRTYFDFGRYAANRPPGLMSGQALLALEDWEEQKSGLYAHSFAAKVDQIAFFLEEGWIDVPEARELLRAR